MTPKIIELKQAPVVLAELPNTFEKPHIKKVDGFSHLIWAIYNGHIISRKRIGYGDVKLVGILSDLTEEQFAECVNVYEVSESINIPKMRFYQMLESEKVYTENPFEFPCTTDPKYYDSPYDGTGFYQELYSNDMDQWQEAQQRTIDPKRTVVLLRKGETK